MSKVLEVRGNYKILATNRDYVVINMALAYENHAHFKSIQPLYHLLTLIEHGLMPTSPYMMKAAKRLLGDKFESLTPKRKKENYNNNHRKSRARCA
ncbi:hypothetical protein [Fusibacter ferrireducens]|uniref:Uncharacterized protein n=1 Tax=Fusibacter ferrireducens TaxID=2785058 RepID=A0ABR9ZRG9_9FIRM|nr:hypothetical protein [Fusibacter ferrireducens]MBF4693057.1 hypothetical protein [Fusibacter ferrireducens]